MANLTADILKILIPGKTHVLERNGGEALVYLSTGGKCHMRLENGETRSGNWQLRDDGYATRWDTGHSGEWTMQATERGMDYVSRDGEQRLPMLAILFGDPHKLAG